MKNLNFVGHIALALFLVASVSWPAIIGYIWFRDHMVAVTIATWAWQFGLGLYASYASSPKSPW